MTPKCDACELERIGCGCDGALDDGCFLCSPAHHARPPCYVSDPLPERVPRPDDCPHCHKSMWMGTANPRGCQCKLPSATTCTQRFCGTPVSVTMPTSRPGYFDRHDGLEAEVVAKIEKRVDLFHFVRGLQFHLRHAEEALRKIDGETDSPELERRRRHFRGDGHV